MSEFVGIVRFDDAPIAEADVERLKRNLHGVGQPRIWRPSSSVILAERRGHPAFDNGSPGPPLQGELGRFVVASVRLDSPDDVRASLGTSARDDRTLFATACTRWGIEGAAERLYGEFAAAAWDQDRRRLTLARCALGARSLFYVELPWGVIFGTALQNILPLPDVPRDLDEMMLAHVATLAFQDWEKTIYRHIRRAPVGGVIEFEPGRTVSRRYYTADRIKDVRFRTEREYVDAGRALLDKAVARHMASEGVLATHLSGGLDSTGIAATLARLAGDRPVHAFTRVPGLSHPYDMDERALASRVVERYPNIRWTVVDQVSEHFRDVEPESEAGAVCVPRRSSFNTTWFEPMRAAIIASGAEAVFNGGAGNSTLSFHGAPDFAGQFLRGRWIHLFSDLRGSAREARKSVLRTAAGAAFQAFTPRRLKRWHTRRTAGDHPWTKYSLASPEFLDDLHYGGVAEEVGHDIPFNPLYSRKELRLRMLQGQSGRDLSGALRRSGPPLAQRNPLGDRDVVEFALGVPENLYWRNGTSRWFAKQILADRVPAEVLHSTQRGKQSPEWYALATRRHAEMVDAVERIGRSRLASRVLDVDRMRMLLATWPKDAESARKVETLYGHGLQRAIALGGFLRWHEGTNE